MILVMNHGKYWVIKALLYRTPEDFDSFVRNQQTVHRGWSKSAKLKRNTKWQYQEFVAAPVAKEIPQVQQFTRQMAKMHTLPETSTITSPWTKHLFSNYLRN